MNKEPDVSSLMNFVEGNIPRDKADNRGLSQYINLLFQDERKENQPKHVYSLTLDVNDGVVIKPSEEEFPFMGGLEEFFKSGSKILDLGSGVGNASKQLNSLFSKVNISVFGVDVSVPDKENSIDESRLVGADFKNLPFSDKSMNRIMAVETFPRWYGHYPSSMRSGTESFSDPEEELYKPDEEGFLELQKDKLLERINQTWEEIHRIAAEGCIFRGTIAKCRTQSDYEREAQKFKYLLENGWKVIFYSEENSFHSNFIAYLPKTNIKEELKVNISEEKLGLQEIRKVLLDIAELAKSIPQKLYNLDENNPGDKKVLELGVKFVNIRPNGDSLITSDDLGERYSFALDRGIFYLYEKCVSKVSKDGERDEWKELFRGDRSQLEEVSDKDKIIKVTIELGTALLAVLDQLKASKSA